jgi:NAD-dependent SIR2 family protein deacetylase
MHYDHTVKQDQWDVRGRVYHVYKCSCCGESKDFNHVPNFDRARLRPCPKCKVLDDTSNVEYLIKRKSQLEQDIKAARDNLEACQKELAEVSAKLEIELKKVPVQAPVTVGR